MIAALIAIFGIGSSIPRVAHPNRIADREIGDLVPRAATVPKKSRPRM
jgi:hypothetical protein